MERTTPGRAELIGFIESAKQQAIPDTTIVGVLKANGWAENDIYAGIRDYCERTTGLIAPVRKGLAGGARDAFLYLLSFGTLAAWTIALGSLLFGVIERIWPDPVMAARNFDSHRYSAAQDVAALLVAFPVYLLTTRAIVRLLRDDPENEESPIRKWLTYFALLIAAGTVIGDLITFLAFLLRGEISVRFVAKVAVVLVLAGGVLWYYLSWLRGSVRNREFAGAAVVLVAAGLIAGFVNLGSPAHQRAIQADRVRIGHLRSLAHELHARPDALPESLKELRSQRSDPVTGVPYDYRALAGSTYELCAIFSGELRNGFWSHAAGRDCFTLDAKSSVP
jgi:hypothetical protein